MGLAADGCGCMRARYQCVVAFSRLAMGTTDCSGRSPNRHSEGPRMFWHRMNDAVVAACFCIVKGLFEACYTCVQSICG
jgi:hypothetical protein